jgi:hypothetical protein
MDVDREIIDILEGVLKGDNRGKGKIESISEWLNIVRSRQGRRINNYGDGLWQAGNVGGFDDMDGGSSEGNTRRYIESAYRDNKQKGKTSIDLNEMVEETSFSTLMPQNRSSGFWSVSARRIMNQFNKFLHRLLAILGIFYI